MSEGLPDDPERLREILARQKGLEEVRAADDRFGERAVASGAITPQQLHAALREQARAWARGEARRLGEILAAQGTMNEESARTLLTPLPTPPGVPPQDGRRSTTVPARLGAVQILREIGRGAMGVVYEGIQQPVERPCAVKVLARSWVGDEAAQKRFLREARTLAGLRHPNLVTLYEAGTHEGTPYLVMELVRGRSLESVIQEKGRLPARRACRILVQMCGALAAAHARGVVHRDVKPANVLLDETDHVMVTDFGMSRRDDLQSLTETGSVLGSPAYMSPEQAAGAAVDARTDVYAAGATLYEAVTGRAPVEGNDIYEVLKAVQEGRIVPPRKLSPLLSADIERVILRAMARRPQDRYPDIQSLAVALQPFAQGTAGGRGGGRRAWIAAAAVAGVAATGGGVWILSRPDPADSGTGTGETADHSERLRRDAARARERGDLSGAAALWERALAAAPDPEARLDLVETYLLLRRAGDAREPAERAVSDDPRSGRARLLRAKVRAATGDPAGARADLAEALRPGADDRTRAGALSLRAQIAAGSGDLAEAAADYMESARIHMRIDDLNGSLAALDALGALGSPPADALYLRSIIARRQGQIPEQERLLRACIQVDPGHAPAFTELGVIFIDRQDLQQAGAALNRAVEIDPDHVLARLNRAYVAIELEQMEVAATDLTRARAVEPGNPNLPFYDGYLAYKQGRWEEAAGQFDAALRAVEQGSMHASVLFLRADCYLKLGQHARAEQDLRSYLQRYPQGSFVQPAREILDRIGAGR